MANAKVSLSLGVLACVLLVGPAVGNWSDNIRLEALEFGTIKSHKRHPKSSSPFARNSPSYLSDANLIDVSSPMSFEEISSKLNLLTAGEIEAQLKLVPDKLGSKIGTATVSEILALGYYNPDDCKTGKIDKIDYYKNELVKYDYAVKLIESYSKKLAEKCAEDIGKVQEMVDEKIGYFDKLHMEDLREKVEIFNSGVSNADNRQDEMLNNEFYHIICERVKLLALSLRRFKASSTGGEFDAMLNAIEPHDRACKQLDDIMSNPQLSALGMSDKDVQKSVHSAQ